jgi:hypothetical protein
MYLRHFKKRDDEKLRDLSPLLLKRRIEKLRRQLIAAQDALTHANEKSSQEPYSLERSWEEKRLELIQVRQRIATMSEQNAKISRSSKSGTLLDWFLNRPSKSDRSAAQAINRELEQLHSRRAELEKSFRSQGFPATRIPEANENPWSKDGPGTLEQLEARERLKRVKAELERHLEALGGDTARLERLEAVEARVFQKERELAAKLRLTFKPTDKCPYCGGTLGSDPHLDHIYPVSKGGLSVSTNLIFVCLQCNQRKADKTLAEFLISYDLDRQAVEVRLKQLGKDF